MTPQPDSYPPALSADLRLCTPEGLRHEANVPGMSEFFHAPHYGGAPMVVLICSPWLDGDALHALADRLASTPSPPASVLIITMLAHEPQYWNKQIAPALGELKQRTGAYIQIRVLPLPDAVDNVAGIRPDALHAKLYLLARNRNRRFLKSEDLLASLQARDLVEGFFGSANFTANGQHLDPQQASHKWELVARIADAPGRMTLLTHFCTLWHSAHRVDKDHPHFHEDWRWPYPGNHHG